VKKGILAGAIVILLVLATSSALVYSGAVSVAANSQHWVVTEWVLRAARIHSIRRHAAGIVPPFELDDRARILTGADHYADHCAICHGSPDPRVSSIADALSPKAPELTNGRRRYSPGELFWIVKNGIKMSGMPSWASHSDTELWSVVAFLERLPTLSPEEYKALVEVATATPHSHHTESALPEHESQPPLHHSGTH
jgi:mono/diheme cytochrome c family protein